MNATIWIRGRCCRLAAVISPADRSVGIDQPYLEYAVIWDHETGELLDAWSDLPESMGGLTDDEWKNVARAVLDSQPFNDYDHWIPCGIEWDSPMHWEGT